MVMVFDYVKNDSGFLVGTVDYYEAVLEEVNEYRADYSMLPLTELPTGAIGSSYTTCAVGLCFDSYDSVASQVCEKSPLLRHFERSFECGILPELGEGAMLGGIYHY